MAATVHAALQRLRQRLCPSERSEVLAEQVLLLRRSFPMTLAASLLTSLAVSYTHLRAHETKRNLVCRVMLEKKRKQP